MKWVLAGLAFALLVSLAVFTVALKTRNLEIRARISRLNERIMALRMEQARLAPHLRANTSTEELIRRLRELIPARAGSQSQ